MDLSTDKNRVLIVEDDDDFRELICEFLEDNGFHVHSANCGQSAMVMLQHHKPDIALLDVMLPDIDGFEICRWIQREDSVKDTAVIFITARSGLTDKIAGYVAGAKRYLCKPFFLDDLLAQVSSLRKTLEYPSGDVA